MSEIKILGIAPYEELKYSMEHVSKSFTDVQIEVYTADLEDGQLLAKDLIKHHYDAIISRGGTADLIRQSVSIPVIDVSISIYDILSTIRLASNYTDKIAIVGFSSITEPAHLLCDILGYQIRIITLQSTLDMDTILNTLKKEKYEMILCDVITSQHALTKSLNTILITSGFESIKRAFQEAIEIAKHLKNLKHRNLLFQQICSFQLEKILVCDTNFQVYFSNLPPSFCQSILKFLSEKVSHDTAQQYHFTFKKNIFHIVVSTLQIEEKTYYHCSIRKTAPALINNKFGITYQTAHEVQEDYTNRLFSARFIQEHTKQELQKINMTYNSILIFGEVGTAKSSIAVQAFLNQQAQSLRLISINSALVNEKMWKFLINASNGPLVESGNTLLFQNIEQLSSYDTEQLITIIKNTKLAQRNNLIFIYNTNNNINKTIYNRLVSELRCATIYAPSLRERKNELNAIITLLLNKINIECNKNIMGFAPKALKELIAYDWPGNLNQLQLALKEFVINAAGHYISEHQVMQFLQKEQLLQDVSSHTTAAFTTHSMQEQPTLFDYTKEIVLRVLEQNDGNQTKTAQQLAISRTTLWRYLKK